MVISSDRLIALAGVWEPPPTSSLPALTAFSHVWMVPSGIPNSLAALAPPISLASFTACTLYSWSYLRATLNTSLFSWFYYEILENKLSTFFIPHQYDWAWFCSQRVFQNHTQPIPCEQYDEVCGQSQLFRKFASLS